MSCQIVFTDTAKSDLREIAIYIAERAQDKNIAIRFVKELQDVAKILETFPESGAIPRDRILKSSGYRFLSHKDYLLFYLYEKEENIAYILAVFNRKRNYVRVMKKFLLHQICKVPIASCDGYFIRAAKAYDPRYRVGYLFTEQEKDPVGVLKAISGEEICPEAHTMTPEQTALWHNEGLNVRAWGVYNTDLMAHAIHCGADGMTVNFPDKLTVFLQD